MKVAKRSNKLSEEKLTKINPSGKKDESFFNAVYEIVRQIPRGRVTSYGAIAACLGTKSSARMVGWAMNAAHDPRLKVPAHRVVNRNGMLTGRFHFSDPDEMQRLLEKEKVSVENNQVKNFDKVFWDPTII
jgi:methylated-DNA-protein-cysteine methyltransferase-like protein